MKVTQLLAEAKDTIISYEILPPTKGKSIDSIYDHLDPLMEFKPSFINVTYHRAEQTFKKRGDGSFERVEIRKRPGTVGICAALMNKYKVEAIPHLICGGFSKEETENALIDLDFLGIKNVLALRGDAAANEKFFNPHPAGHSYAEDLVRQIVGLNNGLYMEDDIMDGAKTDFCIGIAGYPEKHFESPNTDTDIYYLKRKIDLGADYVTTQLFYNNEHYYAYVNKCREFGIEVPIIPGLKPITNKKQLTTIPRVFNIEIPVDLYNAMMKAKTDADCEQIGTEWLTEQCRDLLKNGAKVLHFYTLGKPRVIYNVLKKLF
ncbi:methylenetetrahydrofolate reductase [NAD(P)H] [Nemorincola caseinilytica]|uniref:Methylenetetrahydrofolate reductase n=1 Tax=Nemorincola caseinilytica TaxID=2054315 RepID=A0ABP8NLU6_9BACT